MFMFRCVACESVEPLDLWEKYSQSSGKWLTSVVVVFLSSGPLHINSRPLQAYRVFCFVCLSMDNLFFDLADKYSLLKKCTCLHWLKFFISYNKIQKAKLNLKRLFFFTSWKACFWESVRCLFTLTLYQPCQIFHSVRPQVTWDIWHIKGKHQDFWLLQRCNI